MNNEREKLLERYGHNPTIGELIAFIIGRIAELQAEVENFTEIFNNQGDQQ